MNDILIRCSNVTKSFSGNNVLDNICLDIKKGDCIAIIGKNGCGKSTLLKLLCGLDTPTSGSILRNNGLRISYVPDRFPKVNMTSGQYVMNIGMITFDNKKVVKRKKDDLFSMFHIEKYEDVFLKHLSKGTLQKIAIIQAILTEPDIIFMDEPLTGQDLDSQYAFVNRMRLLLDKQVSIVFICHESLLIDKLAKDVYRIENGVLLNQKNTRFSGVQCIKVEDNHITMPAILKETSKLIEVDNELIKFYVEEVNCNRLISSLLAYKYKIKEVTYENDKKLY